ncbi:SRPBCC family protein [Saccharopolyspora rhizosphaerae]|uniref:SRPBCC family protein n=1 Tax=Saccharopolyspora rhizosphaerae TaxID=2492662 RepID=A0A3R8P2H9_9PSEU|nr:SRPBCC family protein [Saccharopolyspora rhizosphaerae]RRO18632.1 SRPBCC family protein [Saccharopolyspora rhizosphaerae]
MGHYEHSTTLRCDADALFNFLADAGNLPEYFDAMTSAEKTGQDEVRVVAEVEGQRREGRAWLQTDPQARSMRWSSEGPNDYHGELQVNHAGDGQAKVTVSLRTERADGPGIRAGLEQTLANIKRLVEGRSTQPAG